MDKSIVRQELKGPLSLNIIYWLINIFLVLSILIALRLLFYEYPELLAHIDNVRNMSVGVILLSQILRSILIISIIISLWIFRKFMRRVKLGEVFTHENIRYLKRFAFGILVLVIIGLANDYVITHNFKDIYMNEVPSKWPVLISILIFGVFVRSLAHIFSIGFKLQKEKDLTI